MKKIEFWFWLNGGGLTLTGFTADTLVNHFWCYLYNTKQPTGKPFTEVFNQFLTDKLNVEIDENDSDYIEARFLCMPLYIKPMAVK